jgi:hypothetical protein
VRKSFKVSFEETCCGFSDKWNRYAGLGKRVVQWSEQVHIGTWWDHQDLAGPSGPPNAISRYRRKTRGKALWRTWSHRSI